MSQIGIYCIFGMYIVVSLGFLVPFSIIVWIDAIKVYKKRNES